MLTTNQRDLLAIELARLKMRTLLKGDEDSKLIMQEYTKWFEHYRLRIEFFEDELGDERCSTLLGAINLADEIVTSNDEHTIKSY